MLILELRNKIIYHLFLLAAIFMASQNSFAQTDPLQTDTLTVHTISGKDYYIHIVKKGESLYAIHKMYNVPQDVIKKENPGVLDGLSIGEKIFIPLKNNPVEEPSVDGNFINHTVQKKQTLYAIARLYKLKQKEIIAVNPEVADGLKEGQIIKIPVRNIQKNKKKPVENTIQKYKTHTVKRGETLYSLSKLYKVTVDSIKIVNDGLKGGLKENETIRIPIQLKKKNAVAQVVSSLSDSLKVILSDTIEKKSIYKIGLLLPFYLDENDEMVENRNALEEKAIYPKSKFAVEFYNGFIMALDAISTDSCQFQVYVYDTKGKDSTCTKKLLLKKEFKDFDLIVGPLYYSNFKQVAAFAKQNQIPIVSPVRQNNKILLGNPFVFKSIPSKPSTINQISTLAIDSFRTENLLAIIDEKAKEKSLVDLYINSYNKKVLSSKDTMIYSSITPIRLTSSYTSILSHLKAKQNNVIFVPSSNTTFITNLFNYLVNTLNKKEYQDYQITLIGLEEWLKYENIDLEYFQKLNVYLPVNQYINYQDSLTNKFIKDYVNRNETYPSKISFLASDLAIYFGGNLSKHGTVFYNNPVAIKPSNYSICLTFFKTGIESGYENTNSYLLHFQDYILKKVY
jgi:LysM repeat protein